MRLVEVGCAFLSHSPMLLGLRIFTSFTSSPVRCGWGISEPDPLYCPGESNPERLVCGKNRMQEKTTDTPHTRHSTSLFLKRRDEK